ncbi:MAG: ABC transporter ATP-binding protein [Desulfobacter sp.]|nr:MAG: ABC transporter ATP-binding protein [Desulfobacter sp.]
MSDPALLTVQNLSVGTPGGISGETLVENISFRLNRGEVMAITGQSGSGKTLTAMALAGILPAPLAVCSGKVRFMGNPVSPEKGAQKFLVSGRDIMMLFQSPSRALDPWVKIGTHLADAIQAARPVRREKLKETAVHALEKAGMDAEAFDRYPFELSGGQRQRCLMALALAIKPRILIADEPATGQDDMNKALVIEIIQDLTKNEGTAVILISHDLRGLQGLAKHLAVIYKGRQIEAGPVRNIIENPFHSHTRELVRAMKFIEGGGR